MPPQALGKNLRDMERSHSNLVVEQRRSHFMIKDMQKGKGQEETDRPNCPELK